MAFSTWEYIIIYNDGVQTKSTCGASSYAEAYSKASAAARCGASAHKGVAQILVNQR